MFSQFLILIVSNLVLSVSQEKEKLQFKLLESLSLQIIFHPYFIKYDELLLAIYNHSLSSSSKIYLQPV